MQGEQSLAFHEKTHFIFAVPVFFQKFLPEGGFVRVVRNHADHIHGLVAFIGDQSVNVCLVGLNHFILPGAFG